MELEECDVEIEFDTNVDPDHADRILHVSIEEIGDGLDADSRVMLSFVSSVISHAILNTQAIHFRVFACISSNTASRSRPLAGLQHANVDAL